VTKPELVDPVAQDAAKIISTRIYKLAAEVTVEWIARNWMPRTASWFIEEVLAFAALNKWIVRSDDVIHPGRPIPGPKPDRLSKREKRLRWGPSAGADW
jgi:hypothetical protein